MNNRSPNNGTLLRKRLSCLLLALLMLLTLPAQGCSAAIQKTAAYQYFNPPQMVLAGEYPCVYPSIENCWNSESINQRLSEYFAPLMSAVSSADAEYTLFAPRYEMEGAHGKFTIHSAVSACLGGEIALPDIYLDNGELSFVSQAVDISPIEGGLITVGTLFADEMGISDLIGGPSDPMDMRDMYEMFVRLYEGITCSATDVSRFSQDVSYSDLYKKARALELPVFEYELDPALTETATCFEFSTCMSALINRLFADHYGVSSQYVSRSDALDMTRLFMEYYKDAPFIYDSWENCVGKFLSAEHYGVPESKLSRRSFASLWMSAYKEMFGDINDSDILYKPEISDTEDDECLECVYLGMMDTFPSFGSFSPEYYVHMSELSDLCRSFGWVCYNKWQERLDYNFSIDYSNEDVILSLARTMLYLSRYSPAEDRRTVNNGHDYDWYVSQYTTGSYADINCMPTITTMAARWYYGSETDITAQKLREDWLPEYKEGWYMFQVTGSLEKYDIPYEEIDFDEDRGTGIICGELDKGRIILTQMSEAELGVSGHCLVIYGYKKCGNSVEYFIHDPGIYNGTDDFGRYPGDSIRIDSGYVNWIITRITYEIVSVGR